MRRIRQATARDAPDLARVYVDTWRSMYAGLLPGSSLVAMSYRRNGEFWSHAIASGRGILVAESKGGVVGFASSGPSRDRRFDYAGEIYTLYILDDHQGLGIGRELLAASFRDLVERGHASALVWTLILNPSRFFYEAMGGRRVAERDTALWGTTFREAAYGWPDLARAAARAESPRNA